MPDNIYKSGEIKDEGSGITVQNLGPEEEFAGNVLKSLKEKIADARQKIQELEEEIEEKKQQAEKRREEILQEARNEAEQIRQEAEDEAQELVNEKQQEVEASREEGYEEGYADGEHEARETMADLVAQAQTLLREAKREREAFLDQNVPRLVELAGTLAEQVVREYLELDSDTVERVVRDALEAISEVREVTVVLNPQDAQTIRSVKDEFQQDHPNLQEITISEDPKMDRGGCRIRTNFGDIQATVRDQIDHLTETLIEGFDDENAEVLTESESETEPTEE